MSEARHIDGLWVGSSEEPPYPGLRRVEDALLLIKQHSPLHYSRVVRNLSRVWVTILPTSVAEYDHSLNACLLDERFVNDASEALMGLASTIVHEATHARMERWGVKYEEQKRSRIEAICFRRELSFAASLADGVELQEQITRSLQWYEANPDFFSNANFRDRHGGGMAEALRHLGTPEWLIRTAPTIQRLISRVRRVFRSLRTQQRTGRA